MKGLVTLFFLASLTILTGCQEPLNYKQYANWEVTKLSGNNISWTKFKWVNGNLGSKYYERIAMYIPCGIDGLPNSVTFQLDLGAYLTGVYETTFGSFYAANPALKSKIKPLYSSYKYYDDLTINFDSFSAANKLGYVYAGYGNIGSTRLTDTLNTGTIGPDIFQKKVLLIDYPNKRFAICNTIPADYAVNLVDITLDEHGRVILPMALGDKSLKILFDTGSSLFPIITDANKIGLFSTSANIDVIQITSWGQLHDVTGKMISDSFVLAGQTFSNVKAYSSTTNLGTGNNYDGITGNALFWDRTVVIDFTNRKFGIK